MIKKTMLIFLKGLLIGLAIAAPVGPIGVLCIQRSLQNGFKTGFLTGLGAACADGVYGLIAAFSLTAISTFLLAEQRIIRFVGGLFLIYLGIGLLLKKARRFSASDDIKLSTGLHAFTTSFFLTLTNPMTILSFLAVFAGLGLGASRDYWQATLLVCGITLGSALWWLLLSGVIGTVVRRRMATKTLRSINLLSGSIILIFALFALQGRFR